MIRAKILPNGALKIQTRADSFSTECADMKGKVWWHVFTVPANRMCLQNRAIQRDLRFNPFTAVQLSYQFSKINDGRGER